VVSFKNYLTFKQHTYRNHRHVLDNSEVLSVLDGNEHCNIPDEMAASQEQKILANSEAAFILKLKVCHNVSNAAVTDIIESVSDLCQLRMKVERDCLSPPIDGNRLQMFQMPNMFASLNTDYKQSKFFRENLGLNAPVPVKLGERFRVRNVKGKATVKKVDVLGYYVPILKELENLLSMPEVADILNNHGSNMATFIQDVSQGSYVSSHDFVQTHRNALLFCLYYDDYEVVNPIGTHRKKHKQSVFYFQLLNLPPEFRSRLSSIQLIACAKSGDVKEFGVENLLCDFVKGLQKLYEGVLLNVAGSEKLCHGLLAYVVGDTLAAQMLGGFKEGVGTATKPCRTCEISHNQLPDSRLDNSFVRRDEQEHRDRCTSLNGLSKKARAYWSQEYGINSKSLLLDIPGFSITKGILHDPMHVLLEGVDRVSVKLLLYQLIMVDRLLTLEDLNTAITNFSYSCTDALDKPRIIEKENILPNGSMTQSAASMRVLMYQLPYLIGAFVPHDSEHWMNFIRLLQINILTFSPCVSLKTICSLRALIATHNRYFCNLYPNATFIPKLHYLTHFPEQMRMFGPLRHQSCMRFEAKHGFVKAKKWRNFKALEKSVAEYHQNWMCLQQMDVSGGRANNFLYRGDEVKFGYSLKLEQLECVSELLACNPLLSSVIKNECLISPEIKVKGITYLCGSVLVNEWLDGCEPDLFEVQTIVVHDHSKYLVCDRLHVLQFEPYLNSLMVENTNKRIAVQLGDLYSVWPQIVHKSEGRKYVMLHCVDDVWSL
jgi:hypothetical protein